MLKAEHIPGKINSIAVPISVFRRDKEIGTRMLDFFGVFLLNPSTKNDFV
jgi:hypothetical protein